MRNVFSPDSLLFLSREWIKARDMIQQLKELTALLRTQIQFHSRCLTTAYNSSCKGHPSLTTVVICPHMYTHVHAQKLLKK